MKFLFCPKRKKIHLRNIPFLCTQSSEKVSSQAAPIIVSSVYWPLYINDPQLKNFAEKRFVEHVNSFTAAYEALGADSPDAKWLSNRENKYPIFKNINYRIFSRKK